MNFHLIFDVICAALVLILTVVMYRQNKLLKRESLSIQRQKEIKGIVRSISEGIITLDLEHRIIHINKHAREMLNTPREEELKGKWFPSLVDLPEVMQAIRDIDEFQEHKVIDREFPRGKHIYHLKVTHLKSGENEVIGHLLVLSDITRMRKLETHRKEFVANVSHELRTPLTSIQGACDVLLGPDPLPLEQQQYFLQMLKKNATRLQSIVESLLLLADLDRDLKKPQGVFEWVLLEHLLNQALEAVSLKVQQKKVTIQLQNPYHSSSSISCQSVLVLQAITNLLDNALKYGPESGRITIGLSDGGDDFILSVTDEGPGIQPEYKDRLFERFYSIDKARSRQMGGAGLGLSIVKNIMEMHRGEISVESIPGHGATFKLHFPISRTQLVKRENSPLHLA